MQQRTTLAESYLRNLRFVKSGFAGGLFGTSRLYWLEIVIRVNYYLYPIYRRARGKTGEEIFASRPSPRSVKAAATLGFAFVAFSDTRVDVATERTTPTGSIG